MRESLAHCSPSIEQLKFVKGSLLDITHSFGQPFEHSIVTQNEFAIKR